VALCATKADKVKAGAQVAFGYCQAGTLRNGVQSAFITKAHKAALQFGLVCINDGGGARIEEGVNSLDGYSGIFTRNTLASGIIPQISVILGPCAGGACYSPAITDFIFMTEKTSQMFITGPGVVKAVTAETVSPEGLGGAGVHSTKSGVSHFVCKDDKDCLEAVRNLLSYLPQSNLEKPPVAEKFKAID
jgi:propionyl-CoA carboxylase beta chain